MSKNFQKIAKVIATKYDMPVYTANPSVPARGALVTKPKPVQSGDRGYLINGGTGEIVGEGNMVFYEMELVDDERFVKLYAQGMGHLMELSAASKNIVELIHRFMQDNPNRDLVPLVLYSAQEIFPNMQPRTFQRGVRELLLKEFIYRSPVDGLYFINIRYMYNGDRMALINIYERKKAEKPPSAVTAPAQDELFAASATASESTERADE